MATLDDLLRELPAAARPTARKAWEALPPSAREGLERALEDLPSDLTRWRTLLALALEHAQMAAGGKSRVAIVGPANVGKSTLFNRLLRTGEPRAEEGPVPGTTRVSQESDAGAFALVDTPGADAVGEVGEAEKARALAAARAADVLLVTPHGPWASRWARSLPASRRTAGSSTACSRPWPAPSRRHGRRHCSRAPPRRRRGSSGAKG